MLLILLSATDDPFIRPSILLICFIPFVVTGMPERNLAAVGWMQGKPCTDPQPVAKPQANREKLVDFQNKIYLYIYMTGNCLLLRDFFFCIWFRYLVSYIYLLLNLVLVCFCCFPFSYWLWWLIVKLLIVDFIYFFILSIFFVRHSLNPINHHFQVRSWLDSNQFFQNVFWLIFLNLQFFPLISLFPAFWSSNTLFWQ